jgi:hypothetical protein
VVRLARPLAITTTLALAAVACETTVNLGTGPDAAPTDAAAGTDAGGDATQATDATQGTDAGGADGGVDAPAGSDAGTDAADAAGGPKGIFVTRSTYFPDFGSVSKADFRCQTSAGAQQLPGTWKAWMSDSTKDAADRITSDGPWIAVVTGVLLFQNKAALRGFPLAALATDELGKPAPDRWWTGTLANGLRSPSTCLDWTTQAQGSGGQTGTRNGPGVPGKEWTEDLVFSCQDTFALICLQD